ncbi:hypothetical protein QQP08_017807, partial [Theobroma cacao]
KYGQYFLPRIAAWNQEKIHGWLTCIKDFKNPKNVQILVESVGIYHHTNYGMKLEGKLSFDAHLSSQIKTEIKSLKYEIKKLKRLLEYDKNNEKLKEKEKQQEYKSSKCEIEKLKGLLDQKLKEKEKQREYESLKCEIEKLKGLLDYDKNNQKLKEKKKQQEYEVFVSLKNDIAIIKADMEAIQFKEFCVPKFVCTTSYGGNPMRDEHAREEPLCKEDGSNYGQSNAPTANEGGSNIVLSCDNLGNYNIIQDFPNESPKEFPKELTLYHLSIVNDKCFSSPYPTLKENMSSPTISTKDKVKRYIVRKALEDVEIVLIRSSEGDKECLLDAASFVPTLVNKKHLPYQISNVKEKVHKNTIKKSKSKEKIVDFIDTYAIRTEIMTLEPRKWLDDIAS